MKYCLFNHSGSLNRGCEAIIRSTISIISKVDNDAQFLILSFDPESDKHIDGITIKKMETRKLSKFEHFIAAVNIKLFHSEYYSIKKMYSQVVNSADDCDVCLSVGGDTYCYGDNKQIQVITKEFKKKGKKVFLWGASIGEEDLNDDKIKNLGVFDAIFVREEITFNLLKNKNVNKNIFFYSDPAFCLQGENMSPIGCFEKSNTIGLNFSPLICKYNPEINNIMMSFADYIMNNTELYILLIPHVIEEGNNDYEIMLELKEKYKENNRIEILPYNLNAMQYKGYIANTRYFIGARTHATIGAYSSGVPTIVIGYSVKSRGISRDIFGDEKYIIDSKNLKSCDELIEKFNSLVSEEKNLRAVLASEIPVKIESAMGMGEKLLSIIRTE